MSAARSQLQLSVTASVSFSMPLLLLCYTLPCSRLVGALFAMLVAFILVFMRTYFEGQCCTTADLQNEQVFCFHLVVATVTVCVLENIDFYKNAIYILLNIFIVIF